MIQHYGGDARREPPRSSGPDTTAVRTHLERILASLEFERAGRMRLLLEFLVRQTLSGHSEGLKESLLGIEVFGRDPGYDPKIDPVVRVTVSRLRAKLETYYQREGQGDPLRIVIPKGSYVPKFETVASAAPAPSRRPAVLIAAIALLITAAAVVAFRLTTSSAPPSFENLRPFVTGKGSPNHPSFSPAGDMLAFDWAGPGDRHTNIYVQRLDASVPVRLTDDAAIATWPVWSKDGRDIAYLREITPVRVAIVSQPWNGGGTRQWVEFQKGATDRPRLDWSPDGKWFATAQRVDGMQSILLFSLETASTRLLTHTPPGWRGDSEPVFSPDSKRIAFRRTQQPSGVEDIFFVPVSGGEPRRATFDDRPVSAFVFATDGGLVFSSRRAGDIRGLWWLPPSGGSLRRISSTAVDAGSPSISRDGRHVAFVKVLFDTDVWRVNADGSGAATRLVASDLPDGAPQFSPDGRRIVFQSSRDGAIEIWTCEANGAGATRLTNAKGTQVGLPQWSPDGQWIAYEAYPRRRGEIHVVPARGGPDRTLVSGAADNTVPRWSADSRSIYFASNRSGRVDLWRVALDNGRETRIAQDAYAAAESRDEHTLYFTKSSAPEIWKQPLQNGLPSETPERVPVPARQDAANLVLASSGVYYLDLSGGPSIRYLDFASGATRTVYSSPQPLWRGGELALSPDQRTLLFTVIERDGMNIFAR